MEDSAAKFSWVTASPKFFCEPLATSLARADELKFIISEPSDLPKCEKYASAAANAKAFWLHPEWSKAGDAALLKKIWDFAVSKGGLWRAGWQLHKLYFAR